MHALNVSSIFGTHGTHIVGVMKTVPEAAMLTGTDITTGLIAAEARTPVIWSMQPIHCQCANRYGRRGNPAYRHLTMTEIGLSALGPFRMPLRDGVT